MSNKIEQQASNLERVISAMLGERERFDFRATFLAGRTDFHVGAPAACMGTLVGVGGANLRALSLLTEILGRQLDQQWLLVLEEPEDERRIPLQPDPTPEDHDASDDCLLLSDILESCGVECAVHVQGGIAGGYDFTLLPETQKEEAALTDNHPAIYRRTKRGSQPISLLFALGVIWKCLGKRQGVNYRISIA